MDHANDTPAARPAGYGDLGRDRRRAFTPVALDIAEAEWWLPGRHFSHGASIRTEVEVDCATDMLVNPGFGEPGRIAGSRRHRLPHLLGRAIHDQLHLDPAL